MPRFSRFYSATEAEAAAALLHTRLRAEDAPPFTSLDAKHLDSLLKGVKNSTPRARNDVSQPLYLPRPSVQSVEQLLKASGFTIAQEIVHRTKPQNHESFEDPPEWESRSHTPSSDDMPPRKHRRSARTLSPTAEVSSVNAGSEGKMAHMIEHPLVEQPSSWENPKDFHATYSHNVLQTMDTQFSKWSYDLNEGTTAIPFVMAQAPTETHDRLVEIDRRFWATSIEGAAENITNSQATAKAVLEHVQRDNLEHISPSRSADTVEQNSSDKHGAPFGHNHTSKRAAMIARSKVTKDNSLVMSKSVPQRRSALHKNKGRRSIMSSPPPTARKSELVQEAESQAEHPKATVLLLNSKEDQRRDVDYALQNGSIDLGDRQRLEVLMEHLGKVSEDGNKGGAVKEAKGISSDQDENEQLGRLKGKARTKAKRCTAR